MSERAAMAGDDGPPHVIVHKGRTYTIRPVLTEDVLLSVETKLWERAKAALHSQKDMMSEDMYERKLDELRKRYEDGVFSFESKTVMEFLKTQKGSLMLLACICDCSEAEALLLIAERGPEIKDALKTVISLSFPKEKSNPKWKARRRR